MKTIILLSVLITAIFCTHSGIKLGLDMEVFKIIKQINFNKFLANKILLNHTEITGEMVFDYELIIDNLTMIDIQPPKGFDVYHLIKDDETPYIKLNLQNIEATIATDFYVKYGLLHESGNQTHIRMVIESIEGEFYFTPLGDVEISEFEVVIDELEIDLESGLMKFIYTLAKNLIIKEIENQIRTTTTTISTYINKWDSEPFLYDLGFGIGFNLTNIDRPMLHPHYKQIKYTLLSTIINLIKSLVYEENIEKSLLSTTILTCGIHGSVYPNLEPNLKPDIPEAVNMEFAPHSFDNEINLLLSDYTLNTLLFMAQQTGILHKEFTEDANTLFPFEFNVKGVSSQIPEFLNKYPNDNFPVQMKAYIATKNWKQPIINSTQNGSNVVINFGIDFDTTFSDDPFDDPARDLQLNITMDLNIQFTLVDNVLTINVSKPNIISLVKTVDEIKADEANLKKIILENINTLVLPLLDTYTKDLKVIELLNDFTGLSFKNFKLASMRQHLAVSLGFNELNFEMNS